MKYFSVLLLSRTDYSLTLAKPAEMLRSTVCRINPRNTNGINTNAFIVILTLILSQVTQYKDGKNSLHRSEILKTTSDTTGLSWTEQASE